ADVADFALREHGMRWLLHRRAIDARDEPSAGQAVDAFEVGTRVNGNHARRLLRFAGVDGANLRVRMRRAQKIAVRLVRQCDVVRVLPGAGQKARVLLALDRLSDESRFDSAHGDIPTWPSRRRPAAPP